MNENYAQPNLPEGVNTSILRGCYHLQGPQSGLPKDAPRLSLMGSGAILLEVLKAAELLDESNYSQAQLDAYDRHLMAVYDINRSRIESYDKGIDKGLQLSVAIYKDIQDGQLTLEAIALKNSISLEEVKKLAAVVK
jgi:hypothetical protein